MRSEDLYMANLSFLLDYGDGTENDEIEYELFKIAFQNKEEVHYDRVIGGNFMYLEQEPSNLASVMNFSSNFIESIHRTNKEKNSDPYIVVGFEDIMVSEEKLNEGEYLVNTKYRLLKDINKEGTVTI
jgi:hypothetical protein